jgi:hypothetical protein
LGSSPGRGVAAGLIVLNMQHLEQFLYQMNSCRVVRCARVDAGWNFTIF